MMTNLEVELAALGDALEAAVARKLERPASRWRSSRRRTVALVAAAALLLGAAGAGIGASLLKSPAQESQGLLDASATFAGTHPQCVAVAPQHFRCTVDQTPKGLVIQGSWIGTKMASVNAERRVDGGCVAVSDDGRAWDCYLGDLAIKRGIVDSSVLGQYVQEPAHG
jgi:hypothetical protein